eukprot:10776315-Heterocapsa_arctica.AAC.1
MIRLAAITNQCPWCRRTFPDLQQTRQHIGRMTQVGSCVGHARRSADPLVTPPLPACGICGAEL